MRIIRSWNFRPTARLGCSAGPALRNGSIVSLPPGSAIVNLTCAPTRTTSELPTVELNDADLRDKIGAKAFDAMMERFGKEYAGKTVTTASFRKYAEEAAKTNLGDMFDAWLNKTGLSDAVCGLTGPFASGSTISARTDGSPTVAAAKIIRATKIGCEEQRGWATRACI